MSYQEPEFLPWDGRRVPMTFVGGYLGAGKTTAINELLAHADRPIAVIVNDVGAVNIDASLIRRRHGDTIELTNGCVCCSALDGMGAALDQIRGRQVPPDHVVVELSGVAEPGRMLPWGESAGFMLDGIVVVVAADQLVDASLPEWVRTYIHTHIAQADLLILTKSELLDEGQQTTVASALATSAPNVPVLSRRSFDQPGAVGRFLALGGRRPGSPISLDQPTLFDAHEATVISAPMNVSCAELEAWVRQLQQAADQPIVRAKGMVATTDAGLVLVQVVGRRIELSAVPLSERQQPTDLVMVSLNR